MNESEKSQTTLEWLRLIFDDLTYEGKISFAEYLNLSEHCNSKIQLIIYLKIPALTDEELNARRRQIAYGSGGSIDDGTH